MKYKFFNIPAVNSANEEQVLNQFCALHRIIQLDKQFVESGIESFWAICISWVDNEGSLEKSPTTRKLAVDYKEVLSGEDFAAYARLRELRKQLAEQEGTAVYNIFTNEQLANIVKNKIESKASMAEIKGIGQAKLDKYADEFIAFLKAHVASNKHEAT